MIIARARRVYKGICANYKRSLGRNIYIYIYIYGTTRALI